MKVQVAFSPALQQVSRKINSFLGLLKRASGRNISSCSLQCSIHKSGLPKTVYALSISVITSALKDCYKEYYAIKHHHKEVRATYLDNLAEALAESKKIPHANMLKQLWWRTTDITDKQAMEQAIMDSNEQKFKQSHRRPFYKEPLSTIFGFNGTTQAPAAIFADVFTPTPDIPNSKTLLLQHLSMPDKICKLQSSHMDMTLDSYCNFWLRAKENTSAYPDALSFSTMKAGASSPQI